MMAIMTLQDEDCTPFMAFDVPTVDVAMARSIAERVDAATQACKSCTDADSATQVSAQLELWHQILSVRNRNCKAPVPKATIVSTGASGVPVVGFGVLHWGLCPLRILWT
jgi:hypothetical protein